MKMKSRNRNSLFSRIALTSAVAGALVPCTASYAASITIDPASEEYYDAAATAAQANPGLWDSVRGRISAPFAPGGDATKVINFGDGSDGAFSFTASLPNLSQTGANEITLTTTAAKSIYNFTQFDLPAGKTLKVAGAYPLVIRVRGTSTIAGTIDASGSNGWANVGITAGTGGTGVAGGGNGGNGAAVADAFAGPGLPSTADIDGGTGGTKTTSSGFSEGGGGGCNGQAGANDADPGNSGFAPLVNAGSCGSTRAALAQAFESVFTGGAGGGGGGSCSVLGDDAAGAGAGGGGGAIRISSLGDLSFPGAGKIMVQGGNGGAATASASNLEYPGAGGGGSGGSLWLQSAANISDADLLSAAISISGGTGGSEGSTGADGGQGSDGVFRADKGGSFNLTGGSVHHTTVVSRAATGTYTIVSKPISFADGYYSFSSPTVATDTATLCGNNGSVTVQVQGSSDGVNWGSTVSAANISQLNDSQYLRVIATIQSTGASPPCIQSIVLNYEPSTLNEIKLAGGLACASTTSKGNRPGSGSSPGGLVGDLSLLALAALVARLWRRSLASHQPV